MLMLETNKDYELSDILANADIVFVDSSVRYNEAGPYFCRKTYDAKSYNQIPRHLVEAMHEYIGSLMELLQHHKVWVTEDVTKEFRGLVEHIGEKIHYISSRERAIVYNERAKRYRNIGGRNYNVKGLKDELGNLQQSAYRFLKILRSKEIRWNKEVTIDREKYNLLLDMVKLIEKPLGLKRDTSYRYSESERDRSYDSDTDEKFVVYLYYLSMYCGMAPALLASDTDFVGLLGVTPRLIGSDSFMPENECFRIALKKNPVRLYFKTLESYKLTVDSGSDALVFNEHFLIRKFNKEQNNMLEEKIRSLWKRFSEL